VTTPKPRRINIKSENYSFPFSRGLLATQLSVTGMDFYDSYKTAEAIGLELELQDTWELTEIELDDFVCNILETEGKKLYSERYRNFLTLKELEQPLILLVAGATGIGKSTVSLNLASRLAISHIVGTDAIREVLRKILSPDLIPSLHSSSYTAHESMKEYVSPIYNKVIIGFEEHVRLVVPAIEAVISRAITEGISILLDGVHILPSVMDPKILRTPNVIPIFLYLSDENDHLNRIYARSKTKVIRRPVERYVDHFQEIREIHDFLVEQARLHGIPLIENILLEKTTKEILDLVFERIESIIKV